ESRIPHGHRYSAICRKRGGRRTSSLEALAMILGEINRAAGITTTLDDLFRRAGVRHPDAPALVDAPNRQSFTDGAPRTLNFAQADNAISAVAARPQSVAGRSAVRGGGAAPAFVRSADRRRRGDAITQYGRQHCRVSRNS